jgi:hypothetical protein
MRTFRCFYEYNLNAWDVAAGIVIVRQAGGQVVNFSGGDEVLDTRELIATNGKSLMNWWRLFSNNLSEPLIDLKITMIIKKARTDYVQAFFYLNRSTNL